MAHTCEVHRIYTSIASLAVAYYKHSVLMNVNVFWLKKTGKKKKEDCSASTQNFTCNALQCAYCSLETFNHRRVNSMIDRANTYFLSTNATEANKMRSFIRFTEYRRLIIIPFKNGRRLVLIKIQYIGLVLMSVSLKILLTFGSDSDA